MNNNQNRHNQELLRNESFETVNVVEYDKRNITEATVSASISYALNFNSYTARSSSSVINILDNLPPGEIITR